MTVTWDPQRYVQFGDFRNRPFFDLTARVLADRPASVVDLGCGPGNLTGTLAARWPQARVLGLDSSPEMISAATAAEHPQNLSFSVADVVDWQPAADTDVVVTNAVLQWVPEHRELLPAWLAALRPGAWFAMQVPGNFGAASHVLMREVAESPVWRDRLDGVLRHEDAVGEPADYLEIFLAAGMRADAWETTYQQVLQGPHPVLDWVRGTGLRPVLNALSTDAAAAFEAEYSARLDLAYPQRDFGTVFPFRRIFVVGRKI
ncbi:trans-aconitate 2-methyltransferase [Arthrobacter russicus]|uniref:Trans-aconitate 2-methyltransferase n=1 Tax=Arthrobacter russicus TaxID=172040 RepID=A0ABU1JFQ7_9MICC|nr:trans-aconitate 2-methyltransferase [Arthrobacter russicus]MDR6271269.1 trans-aconitate 2-methyltransferase [Arthrobacter russicus]